MIRLSSLRVTHHVSRIELALVVWLLLLAFFFRTYELTGLGLGLEHDEVAEWQIANSIRHGENALFFKEAYGQEPLFLYLMAGSTALIGDNVIAIRFTSVFVAMLTLAASYRMLRRMFSPAVAIVALAGMSIALWPVFWGRIGLRAMMLPLMLALGFDFLWRGLTASIQDPKSKLPNPFITAGVFFGLSAYTYLSSRALPILLAIFVLYLALFARKKMRGKWRGMLVCLITAGLIALPLVVVLLTQPDLQFRVSEVSGPLDKALKGDSAELAANIPGALGMFTRQGDSTVRDNWPDRPVFPEMIGQLLFLGGVIVALGRFRQPRYVLALLWIGVMLIPTIVTTGAPNFTRALGTLPMVFALPGFMVEWLLFWTPRLFPLQMYASVSRITNVVIVVGLFIVLGINAASTYEDYFVKWPQHPETQFVFQADFAAIARDIDTSNVMDVAVGGLSNDTMDDPSLYLLRQRKDVRVRWFDSGSPISSGGAMIVPNASGRVYIPAIVPLATFFAGWAAGCESERLYQRCDLNRLQWVSEHPVPDATFGEAAELISVGTPPGVIRPGDQIQVVTVWRAGRQSQPLIHLFLHLVDPATGNIIAQHDGLDAPMRYWRLGDAIVQVHHLKISPDAPAGAYDLRLGLYDPDTGQRISPTCTFCSGLLKDSIIYGTIKVAR